MTDQPRILMVDDDQEIGALVADALEMGYTDTVRAYLACMPT